jgi:hypothetical protein
MTSDPSLQSTPKASASRLAPLRHAFDVDLSWCDFTSCHSPRRAGFASAGAELVEPVSNPIAFNSFLPREVES